MDFQPGEATRLTRLPMLVLFLVLLAAAGSPVIVKPTAQPSAPASAPQFVTAAKPAAQGGQPDVRPSVDTPAPAWLAPLFTGAAGLLGALIGGYFATRNAKAAVVQKTNELEIASIDARLSGFVAPFEQLSLENLKMSRELKRHHGGDAFRTLPALLQPGWKESLPKGDRTLVDAVVVNGAKLREMILAGGGAVSPAIRPHLAAASMHFRMLELAHAGGLDQDPDRYSSYVYPRQLDGALALERQRLERRREALRSEPDTGHPTMADLVLPADLALPSDTAVIPPADAKWSALEKLVQF